MSWYSNPQLFIYLWKSDDNNYSQFRVYSFAKVTGTTRFSYDDPLTEDDIWENSFDFSEYLCPDSNKESDFLSAFGSFEFETSVGISKLINSQGLVVNWDSTKQTGTFSREELNSPFWSLPGVKTPEMLMFENGALGKEKSELKANNSKLEEECKRIKKGKESLEEKVSDLEAKLSSLQDQVYNNKVEKEAADKRVSDLEAENVLLKAKVNKQQDEIILDGLKTKDILASLKSFQQQIRGLISKLE